MYDYCMCLKQILSQCLRCSMSFLAERQKMKSNQIIQMKSASFQAHSNIQLIVKENICFCLYYWTVVGYVLWHFIKTGNVPWDLCCISLQRNNQTDDMQKTLDLDLKFRGLKLWNCSSPHSVFPPGQVTACWAQQSCVCVEDHIQRPKQPGRLMDR